MKKTLSILLAFIICTSMTIPALAAYEFESGESSLGEFGKATTYDEPIPPDPMNVNARRNKDNSALPPPFGVFSGEIPTEPSSLYHDNLPDSGFVTPRQQLPGNGGEDYAPGINGVTTGLLPSTSLELIRMTLPQFYADGTIGMLTSAKLGKTFKIYEGEENITKGVAHFASTSAWDGNVALCAHNRSGVFGFLKSVEVGDRFTLTTPYGTRIYEAYSVSQVSETDVSMLGYSSANELTLLTCVENVRELRWCVRAREISA